MKFYKIRTFCRSGSIFIAFCILYAFVFSSCSTFNYKTYDEKANANIDDPEPNYNLTLDKDFQDYTNFMFIGNRVENFGTYFNTYYNAKENFDDAYEDYITRILANYGNRVDSVYINQSLSQEAVDLFNKSIEKASRVIQYHKSSAFMDKAVLLIGKCYYYLGDYIKAERKFGEFASKLSNSPLVDENRLFYSKTQLRLGNYEIALQRLDDLIKNTKSDVVRADAYQTIAEYYLSRKDYESAVANYKKAIEFSSDSEFKAQMQFLLATVIGQKDYRQAAGEYDKVLDFRASFDLEYYARFNRLKYLILAGDFATAEPLINNLRVKYKDNPDFLSQIDFLHGFYYDQKKEFKKAFNVYKQVIRDNPKTTASSNASYQIAKYNENVLGDYLNAFRYYRFSTEESNQGKYYQEAFVKVNLFKKYYDIRSVIAGQQINTAYDSIFILNTKGVTNQENQNNNNNNNINIENPDKGEHGKPGGYNGIFSDSVASQVDSTQAKVEKISKAKFELAELFDYELKRTDSSEHYYLSAFEESGDYDFKSRVLYALSGLYRSAGNPSKADDILKRIVKEYSLSPISNEAKRELNMPVDEEQSDISDSLFNYAENKFVMSDYVSALDGYKQLLSLFPNSKHCVKCRYSAGWIYENIIHKSDSAYMYYSQIIASNPKSEYAAAISSKVKEYEDALKTPSKDSTGFTSKDSTQFKSKDSTQFKSKDSTQIKDSTKITDSVKIGNNEKGVIEDIKKVDQPDDVKDPSKSEDKPDIIKEEDKPKEGDNNKK